MALSFSADARAAKLQASYQTLSTAASTLNAASDKFSEAVSALDAALNNLSPGVTAWVIVNTVSDEESPWMRYEQRLGFAKTNNRWGLSLCRVTINGNDGDKEDTTDAWLFNDAPRHLRIEAIGHVPDLVEALARQAEHTAKLVSTGADLALQLAASIHALAEKGNRR